MNTNESDNTPVIQFDLLKPITNNNPEFTRMLVHAFKVEMELVKRQLKPELNPADLMIISRSFHKIRPSLNMLGLNMLADLLDRFRRPADPSEIGGVVKRCSEYETLNVQFTSVIEQLAAYQAG